MKKIFFFFLTASLFCTCTDKDPDPVEDLKPQITSFNPQSGMAGATVNISGTNLSGVSSVMFNGVAATPVSATATAIEVKVPANATTGVISVVSQAGMFTTANSFTVIPTPEPPVIINAYPASNAVNGPVLIEGNFQDISNVKFNSIQVTPDSFMTGPVINTYAIPVDSNVASIATVRVPAGLTPGVVALTVTSKNGTSKNFNFTVLSTPPVSPVSPLKIVLKPKARYIPVVYNNWRNELNNSFIFIQSGTSGNLPGGTENITGTTLPFVVSRLPTATNKSIEVVVTNTNGTTDKLVGIYADSDLLPQDDPAWQRIIFYDKNGRQIVVHVQVKF